MRASLLCCALLSLVVAAQARPQVQPRPAESSPEWQSACASGDSYEVRAGFDGQCAAQAFFRDDVATTGWAYLHVESSEALSWAEQAYAAGFLEGALTRERIAQSYTNVVASTFASSNGSIPQPLLAWVEQQQSWVAAQVAANPADEYWAAAGALYAQVQGLADGARAAGVDIDPLHMLVLNLQAETGDILASINQEYRASVDYLSFNDLKRVKAVMAKNSHCSALIRLLPDGSDLFSAHTTWTEYAQMLRIFKYYNLRFGKSHAVHFSSYPGVIHSIDDWYSTDLQLIVIETTNNIANVSLYDLIVPQTVPTFARVVMANKLAASGHDWYNIYAQHNSGTYNNQWMITDNKQFTPGQPPRAGTLWVVSQTPGEIMAEDVTPTLASQGFWPSYNIPYFPALWERLGYGSLVKQYGAMGEYLWDYSRSFRALIFARDAPKVADLAGMQAIMQSNAWQTDPLSKQCAELAISARMDLSGGPLGTPMPSGGIDCKISSWSMTQPGQPLSAWAKSGPTVESQAPFQWSTSQWANVSHEGLPDVFDFDWQHFTVATSPSTASAADAAAPVPIALE